MLSASLMPFLMKLTGTLRPILDRKGYSVWSISPQSTVYEALILMAEKGIGALIVVVDGAPLGILSERDYARKIVLHGKASKEVSVKEIMTSPVITVTPDSTVEECMQIMTAHHIRHLPVLEDGKIVGVASIGDLVNWIISQQKATIQHLSNYIAGNYPA